MSRPLGRSLRIILCLCAFGLAAAPLAARQAQAPKPTRDAIVAAARAVVDKARYATFVTMDGDQPEARIVDPFPPENDFTIWIATNAQSRKVGQLQKSRRATLLYFDPAGRNEVTFLGAAEIVRDPAEKAKHWKEDWATFYKDRNRGDDYVLIKVVPDRLEISAPSLGMTNDPATWTPIVLMLKR